MSGMNSGAEGPDLSDKLLQFSEGGERWDSEKFQIWWSEVQKTSSLVIRKSLVPDDWRYLMSVLSHAEVSEFEVLVINLPRRSVDSCTRLDMMDGIGGNDVVGAGYELGAVLLRRQFSMLRTLVILGTHPHVIYGSMGDLSLARAVREGCFKNLRTLSLPTHCTEFGILKALSDSRSPQLMSFSISLRLLNIPDLKNICAVGCFKLLRHLDVDLANLADAEPFWQFLFWAMSSNHLRRTTSLRLGRGPVVGSYLESFGGRPVVGPYLESFVRKHKTWFSCLENLALDGCGLISEEVVSMVAAMMEIPSTESRTQFAFKCLDLKKNRLGPAAVNALIYLAKYNQLPHLQELDLSRCTGLNNSKGSHALVTLIKRIETGYFPSLQTLRWNGNEVLDADAEAIVQAYYTNQSLTTEIHFSWLGTSDLSLRTKLKEYRERNLRLAGLQEKLNTDTTFPSSSSNGGHHLRRSSTPDTSPTKVTENVGGSIPTTSTNIVNHNRQDFIPLTSAKVFLCGFPEVGKTRLRKTLIRETGKGTKWVWETRPIFFKEPRTRGIEISRIKEKKQMGKKVTLVMWDLAGQQEYHVLHGTFLADLGLEGGKSTTFILVFKAAFTADVEGKLLYWLRFAASSSLKHVKRHVLIVLNCFDGRRCPDGDQRLWTALIKEFAKMFGDLLDIHLVPFVVDVRKASSVAQLRTHLFDHAQSLLHDVAVPRICVELQARLKGWSEGENRSLVPILSWQSFEQSWTLKATENHVSSEALKTAASYLHEIGEIIYFEGKVVSGVELAKRSILVPNPEWFCRKVVGELLLPKEMLEGAYPVQVSADGSISVVMFQAFFEHLLVEGTQSDDVISMLELVGLCYRNGAEKIIVPALIREDAYQSISWVGKGSDWVMGRCLTVEDMGRNAIPMILFRRLQVELALHPNFGGRGDSEYTVGKSFSSFRVGELLVLIQFDVDHSDPCDDRIDILAKNLRRTMNGDPKDSRSAEVECICEIMQKVEDLCVSCCPGMTYDIKVIEPSSAANRVDKMSERKLMSLREIKDLVMKGKKYLSWHNGHQFMTLKTFLSEKELKEILGSQTVRENPQASSVLWEVADTSDHSLEVPVKHYSYDGCKEDALSLGLLTKDFLQRLEKSSEWNTSDPKDGFTERGDVGRILQAIQDVKQDVKQAVREEGHLTREHVDKRSEDLLSECRQKHEVLVKSIQAQQSFSIQEKERSVPRYMFLSKKQGQSRVWISLTEAFQSTFHLHLLCESHFETGFLHEVDNQEGIELTKPKKWLEKVSPWLRRSLQVAIVVGKTVGNVYLPGVFNLIPDYNVGNEEQGLAKAVDSAATLLLENVDEGVDQKQDVPEIYGTAAQPVNLKERLIAEEVIRDVIREVGRIKFAKKIRLRRVVLKSAVQAETSTTQTEGSVLWICYDCYKRYGGRVTTI